MAEAAEAALEVTWDSGGGNKNGWGRKALVCGGHWLRQFRSYLVEGGTEVTRRPRWHDFEHDYYQNRARIKLIFSDRCYGKKLYLAQFWVLSIKYFTNFEHTLQFSALFCGQNCTCFRITPSWTVQYCAENHANKITNSYFLRDVTNIRSWIILYLLTWEFILFFAVKVCYLPSHYGICIKELLFIANGQNQLLLLVCSSTLP